MTARDTVLAVLMIATVGEAAAAQGYRVRLDASSQAVSFRGLLSDSIPVAQVVSGPGGALQTPDGHAVRCGAGDYCHFFRAGPALLGVPVTTSANLVMWGLGIEGLTVRATGRLLADLGADRVWPGTEPAAQLIEGYVEYRRAELLGRAGRLLLTSRLEPIGFDGGWLKSRWERASIDVAAYGGWGLAQSAALPVSSPALNPLDEWRPRERQIVAGAEAAWQHRIVDARAEYRREIDPLDNSFVSERTALSMVARAAPFRVAGGVDYNLAEGRFGTADVTLSWLRSRLALTAGARRYVPYFSLWTLWGAFSPVPYAAVNGSAEYRVSDRLTVSGRGERYQYAETEVTTALVSGLRDQGWRGSVRATMTSGPGWTMHGGAGIERGPGASGRFFDGAVTYTPNERYAFDLYGGTLARPLELRYYDATSRWLGGRGEWRLGAQERVWADAAFVDDQRERPDAGDSSLSQVRLRAGMTLTFGSDADRAPLPPARRTEP